MYQQAIVIAACLIGLSQASQYLTAPVLHAPSFTTSAHVGSVQSVSRSFSNVPQTRFTRTDWHQPGSLITAPVYKPIISPVYGKVAVPGPTRYESFLVPRPPLVQNVVSHIPGVAHVPAVAHVAAAVPVTASLPVAAPAYSAPVAAVPTGIKGY